jgi:rhodanese-related sulfurtransferase
VIQIPTNSRTALVGPSGRRAALATEALQALSYGSVAYLDGGLDAWRKADFRVAGMPQPYPRVRDRRGGNRGQRLP